MENRDVYIKRFLPKNLYLYCGLAAVAVVLEVLLYQCDIWMGILAISNLSVQGICMAHAASDTEQEDVRLKTDQYGKFIKSEQWKIFCASIVCFILAVLNFSSYIFVCNGTLGTRQYEGGIISFCCIAFSALLWLINSVIDFFSITLSDEMQNYYEFERTGLTHDEQFWIERRKENQRKIDEAKWEEEQRIESYGVGYKLYGPHLIVNESSRTFWILDIFEYKYSFDKLIKYEFQELVGTRSVYSGKKQVSGYWRRTYHSYNVRTTREVPYSTFEISVMVDDIDSPFHVIEFDEDSKSAHTVERLFKEITEQNKMKIYEERYHVQNGNDSL